MRYSIVAGVMLTLFGCGGAATNAETVSPEACEQARQDARAAWQRVAERASAAARPPEGQTELVAEQALDRLLSHRDALRESPREIEGDEALALSNAMMDGIDELSGEIQTRTRERADDAAEALLTDRGEDGSLRAAEGAVATMQQVLEEARPGSDTERARRRALGELARRATRAANSYETSVELGDRHADRARVSSIPESVDTGVVAVRNEAVEHSRNAREACGVSRTLGVPSL